MTIIHIVMFEPKPGVAQSEIDRGCEGMISLGTKCIHPSTQQPYIKSITGGKQNSAEPVKANFTYGFVVEFASKEDRDYYVEQDPAHREFVQSVGGWVGGIGVFDFEPGVL